MVSCFRYTWVTIPIFFLIGSIVLGSLAITGSIKQAAVTDQTYLLKIDLSNINIDTALNSTSITTSDVSSVLSELGISPIYSFGLWSYCRGNGSNDTSYNVEYCSSPEPLYIFKPYDVIQSTLNDVSIQLPEDVQNYFGTARAVIKLIFITAIIGVCLAFITLVLTVLSYRSKVVSCLSMIVGLLSACLLITAAVASINVFLIISNYFEDSFDTYGIDVGIGNLYFYYFIWAATIGAIIAALFNLLAMCCGRTRTSRQPRTQEEPLMVYQEKPAP